MRKSHRTVESKRGSVLLAIATGGLLSFVGGAAGAMPESNAAPGVASAPPTNILSAFRVAPGFRLQLVASEPTVTAPVAMAFDENGRLFVVERPEETDYSSTNAPLGRIRLLEDLEGDGDFHTSQVYADNLPCVSALACYGGGLFVMAGADLLYLKDSKTNGVADVRNVIFTGFGSSNLASTLALPNNFNWGIDNRIHGASAGVAGFVPGSSAPGAGLVPLSGADFSFDPRALTICAEAGPAETGLSFDNWGRKFTCDFRRPLRTARYDSRYLTRNPFFPSPPQMMEVASPATAIFRFIPAKPLPLAPARAQATPQPAPAEVRMTNLWAATWLTNAQGCVVYRGNAFPTNYLGNVFIADPSAHILHRFVIRERGLDMTALRATEDANTEFLASADASFRPVQVVNGPDGALYIADRQDAKDRGRIYRLVAAHFKPPKPPRLGKATTYELLATLSHPNGWQRDTAARLLYERRDPKAVPLLASLLAGSHVPLARLHALHALDGLGVLNQNHLLQASVDPDERIREHAVLLAEKLIQGGAFPDQVWAQLQRMTADPGFRVRYQLAFTVGDLRRADSPQVLAALLWRDPRDPWMQAAVFSSLADGAGELFLILARDPRVRHDPVGQECLRRLAAMIGVKGRPAEVAEVVNLIDELRSEPQPAFELLYALGEGLHRAGSSLAQADPSARLRPFYVEALNEVLNHSVPVPQQVEAIRLMGVGPFTFADSGDLLLLQLGSGESEALQAMVLATLGRFDDLRIAPAVLQRWRVIPPPLRSDAFTALLGRTDHVAAVLGALESGVVGWAGLSSEQVNFLRTCRAPAISERALRLFGPVPGKRPEVAQRFEPALRLKGRPAIGRDIFFGRCAVCHPPGGATPAIGPNLASVRIFGKTQGLTAILEPNVEVRPDYRTYVLETAQGEVLIGLLRDANAATITLQRTKGGPVVLPRASIQHLLPQTWSIMPAGLEAGLTLQNMADLLDKRCHRRALIGGH